MRHSVLYLEREMRRIGVDLEALGALASTGPLTAEALLRWLRWLPTGLGHAEFMRRLALPAAAGGLELALTDADLPPADPEYHDPEIEERIALQHELERVVWPALRAQHSAGTYGVSMRHGPAAALANLRRLPDGASYEAVIAALDAPAPE